MGIWKYKRIETLEGKLRVVNINNRKKKNRRGCFKISCVFEILMRITYIFAAWMTVKRKWELALEQAHLQVLEEAPKLKQFEPKNLNLPKLGEYSDNMG